MTKQTITDIGPMKTCPRCVEEWPADLEFFHWHKDAKRSGGGRLSPWCKACMMEVKRERIAA